MGTLPVTAGAKEINWFAAMPALEEPVAAPAEVDASAFPMAAVADATAFTLEPQAPHNFVYPEAVASTFTPAAQAEVGADLNQTLAELDNQLSETLAKIVEDAQTANKPRSLFGIQLAPKQGGISFTIGGQSHQGQSAQPARREAMSKARLEAYGQAHTVTRDQLICKGTKDHPWALVYHTQDTEGTKGVLDALEVIVLRQGSMKMQLWLMEMVRTADAAIALSAILAAASEVAADRLLGIFLLTTDGLNGKGTVNEAWSKMSEGVDSGLRLAKFLETTSRHPVGAKGLLELLDTLSAPDGDDWSEATKLSNTFRNVAYSVGGARRLNQTWENLLEHEGGSAVLSRLIMRLSRTPEGAMACLETMHNMAHDKEGAAQLGRVLARLAESRDGGRELLKSFQGMVARPAGERELVRLLVRLAEGGELGRLLSALAKDTFNAYALGGLLQGLTRSSGGRRLVHYAFERTAYSQRQRLHYQTFVARMARCEGVELAGLDVLAHGTPAGTTVYR